MAGLPAQGYTSNALRTVAEVKTAVDDIRDTAAQLPGGTSWSELTISGGAIVPPDGSGGGTHRVDTEGNAASDDLTSITTTNCWDGMLVRLYAENTARVVTIKHGTGNIQTYDGADFVFATGIEWIEFQLRTGTWVETQRRIDDCLTQVTLSAAQNLTANTPTKIVFDTEAIDAAGCWDTSNGYFTALVAGWYAVSGGVGVQTQSVPDGQRMYSALYRDTGSGFAALRIQGEVRVGGAGTAVRSMVSDLVYLGAGHKLALYAYAESWASGTGQVSTTSDFNIRRVR